jgi:hypothetical protein
MQTSQKSIFDIIGETSTSSAGASPANPTQAQASDLEKKMTDISGQKCLDAFGRFPRVGSWAKTFSALLIGMGGWYSKRCRLTWKLKGTKSNRLYFQLVQSTPHTSDKEFGLLLGTPRAEERPISEKFREGRTPTPIEYAEQFKGLLLTPTSVMTDEPPEKMRERAERNGYKNGTQYGSLLSQVKYSGMLPTPTTRDYKGARSEEALKKAGRNETNSLPDAFHQAGKTSQLNPQFVEEMMGFPENWTASPFLSGEMKV